MKLFDVYSLYDIEPVRGEGCYVFDKNGERYLDLYGGHAVISIGHAHPRYVKAITDQVGRLGFYSNSVLNGLQQELAGRLGSFLTGHYPGVLEERYKTAFSGETDMHGVLTRVAEARGCVTRGAEPDLDRAASFLLDDFRSGRLGKITLEFPPGES